MPAAQGVVKWPSKLPTLTALVEELDQPLIDAAVDRVLLVHALEMSQDAEAMLREVWRALAPGGRALSLVPKPRRGGGRGPTQPVGHRPPPSRARTHPFFGAAPLTPAPRGA